MSAWPKSSLHLDAGREFRGGQRQVLYLLEGLQRRGHRAWLCCPRGGELFERARGAGIEVQALTLRSNFDFTSAVRLARIAHELGADLVHAHDARSHGIARIAQGLGHSNGLGDNLFVTRRSLGERSGRLDRLKYATAGVRYIAISKPVRDSLLRLGVRPEDVALVPSGVDVERLGAARLGHVQELGWRRANEWVVGTVGALTREKNHALLLDAFARLRATHPDVRLVLVGDGPLRATLGRRAHDLGIDDSVTFAGRLEDTTPVFAAFDVFALASDQEGLGTALLDAMSAGIPVVTTACGGVLDVARHGDSALVVPPRDAAALAHALLLLHDRPELRTRLVEGGKAVAARHGIDAMVDGTLGAYTRLGTSPTARREVDPARSQKPPRREERA